MGFLSKARGALTSLDNTLTTVLHTAAPIIETLANVADTGIFDNVPVVSNILNVAAFVQGHVDKLTDTDAAMNAVNAYMCLVAQTIERVITVPGVEERVGLQSAIEHVDEIVTDIKDHVVAYVGKHTSCKIGEEFINTFKLGEQDLDETVFVDDLVQLQQALEALQFAVAGETFAVVSAMDHKLDELAEYKNQSEIKSLHVDSRVERLLVDEDDITWSNPEPFKVTTESGVTHSFFKVVYEREVVVAKVVDLTNVNPSDIDGIKDKFKLEIATVGALRTAACVRVLGCLLRRRSLIILSELCPNGSLEELIASTALTPQRQTSVLLDVAIGVKYLHGHSIVHRDLDAGNVLIAADGRCKVTDFGGSKNAQLSNQTMGTMQADMTKVGNVAPEILEGGHATMMSDVYSFGTLCCHVLTRTPPWEGVNTATVIRKVLKGEQPPIPDAVAHSGEPELPELLALTRDCLILTPEKRPTFFDIVRRLEPLVRVLAPLPASPTPAKSHSDVVERLAIREENIDFYEPEPFAKGTFGACYRALYERTVVAAKVIDLTSLDAALLPKIKSDFMNEIMLMAELRSSNIVHVIGLLIRPQELVIVMEYLPGGTLRSRLDSQSASLPLSDQVETLLDIAYGMRYLHQRSVNHRDLKSLNVLVDEQGRCKVADFGQSKSVDTLNTNLTQQTSVGNTGTVPWNAPEVLEGEGASNMSDVYAFGILIWEVMTTNIPWDGIGVAQIITGVLVKKRRPEIPADGDADLISLMQLCWEQDPLDRPDFDSVLTKLEAMATSQPHPNRLSMTGSFSAPAAPLHQAFVALWEEMKEDIGVEHDVLTTKHFVAAVESTMFNCDVVPERSTLVRLTSIKQEVTLPRFEKFYNQWKSSESPDDLAGFLKTEAEKWEMEMKDPDVVWNTIRREAQMEDALKIPDHVFFTAFKEVYGLTEAAEEKALMELLDTNRDGTVVKGELKRFLKRWKDLKDGGGAVAVAFATKLVTAHVVPAAQERELMQTFKLVTEAEVVVEDGKAAGADQSSEAVEKLEGTKWDWMHNGKDVNGKLELKSGGVLTAFGHSGTWSVVLEGGKVVVCCGRLGLQHGSREHRLTMNSDLDSFTCSDRGQRGRLASSNGGAASAAPLMVHPMDKGAVPLWRPSMQGNDWGKGDKPLPDGLVSPAMLEALERLGPHFFGPYPPGMEWTARGVKDFSGKHVGGDYAKGQIWIGDKGAYGATQAHDGNPDGWKCHGRQIIIDKEAGTFFQGYMSHFEKEKGNIYGRERIQGRTIRLDGSVRYTWLDGSQRGEPEVAPFEYSDPGGGENQLETSKKENKLVTEVALADLRVRVTGAGNSNANGVYSPDGAFKEWPRYKHEGREFYIRRGGSGNPGYGIQLCRETGPGRWQYYCEGTRKLSAVGPTWAERAAPFGGANSWWVAHAAKGPAPTFEALDGRLAAVDDMDDMGINWRQARNPVTDHSKKKAGLGYVPLPSALDKREFGGLVWNGGGGLFDGQPDIGLWYYCIGYNGQTWGGKTEIPGLKGTPEVKAAAAALWANKDGDGWVLVFRQTLGTAHGNWKKGQLSVNAGNSRSENYAILDTLESFRSVDGSFRLRMVHGTVGEVATAVEQLRGGSAGGKVSAPSSRDYKNGALEILEARYGWASSIWSPTTCSHGAGCKDVTSIVRGDVVGDKLHVNPGRKAQYMNQHFWPETAHGPAIPRKLAVKYRFSGGPVQTVETAAVPNETVDLLIEPSFVPAGQTKVPALVDSSKSVSNSYEPGLIAQAGVSNVAVRYSSDCNNYYSKSTGYSKRDSAHSTSVILTNKHKGDNATQCSEGAPNAWFTVDLKRQASIYEYVYRGDAGGGNNNPKTWDLQGSNNDSNWTTLRSHQKDGTISMQQSGKFTVATKELYSMFRIQNRGTPNKLCCSGIEFYGDFAGSTRASVASEVSAPSASTPVDNEDAPAMCLVKKGSPNALVFSDATRLKSGETVSLTLSSHAGMGVGRRYDEERRAGPWRYTEAGIHADPVRARMVDGKFLMLEDADLVADVSHWKMEPLNTVNWVGGTTKNECTEKAGGGRDFVVESDGTIACMHWRDLVLGYLTPPMILVSKGDERQLVFENANGLKMGKSVDLTLSSHYGLGLGRMYREERRTGPWRYTESAVSTDVDRARLVDGNYVMLEGADLVLDVSYWKMEVGNTVNWVGGTTNMEATKLGGGGRDWFVNDDGTIGCKHRRDLVLGTKMKGGGAEKKAVENSSPNDVDVRRMSLGTLEKESRLLEERAKMIQEARLTVTGNAVAEDRPPTAAVMTERLEEAFVLKNFDNRRFRLTLESHQDKSIVKTGDCCVPFPVAIMCCFTDLVMGPERGAISFVYHQGSGQLERPECCCQHMHVENGQFWPENKVLSFKCGWMPCSQNERFDLMSDGTIRPRNKTGLALGINNSGGKLKLVNLGDARQLIFKELLEAAGGGGGGAKVAPVML